MRINHDVHVQINHLLAECGIGIALQQRDVRLIPAAPFEGRLLKAEDTVPAADTIKT
jgi:small-conductance mechanosensitive channel